MPDSTTTVVGTLVHDPELRYTQGGRGVATLGLAINYRYQSGGEWKEEASFMNVTAWGTLGENCASSLVKGQHVIVTGRLQQRSYETQQGEKRSVVEIIADEIGPSLRWATAQVEKIARDKPGRSDDSYGDGQQTRQTAPGYSLYDEEPFVDLECRRGDFRNMALTEPWM